MLQPLAAAHRLPGQFNSFSHRQDVDRATRKVSVSSCFLKSTQQAGAPVTMNNLLSISTGFDMGGENRNFVMTSGSTVDFCYYSSP